MCHRNRILHRIQLHRAILKTGCPFARQLDYSHTGHIWSHGNIGQYCVLQVLQQESLQFHQHCTLGIFGCLMLLQAAATFGVAIILLCALWGMAFTASNVVLQAETINNSPTEATSVAMSIFSGLTNLGIAFGSYIGGQVCTHLSISVIGYVGGALALLTFVY